MEKAREPSVVFDRDIETTELKIFKGFKGDIIVNGNMMVDDDTIIECDNLYVAGGIDTYAACNISVTGNLIVAENICTCNIKVNGSIVCWGDILTSKIDVRDDVYVEGDLNAQSNDLSIGGSLECKSAVIARNIRVLKKMKVENLVEGHISVG